MAHMIFASFRQNDVQGRALGLYDLLNMEFRRDSLKMFDQAWEEMTLMGMEKNPEHDFIDSLYHCQLEKSTLMKKHGRSITHTRLIGRSHRATPSSKHWSQTFWKINTSKKERGRARPDKAAKVGPVREKGDGKHGDC